MTYHTKISYTKSSIRILGYAMLAASIPTQHMIGAVLVLVASEIIGIMEELVVE